MPYTTEQLNRISTRIRNWYRNGDGTFERAATEVALNNLRTYESNSNWNIQVALYAEDEIYCEDCGETIGYVTANCERVFRHPQLVVEIDGKSYCDSACANNDGYFLCKECDEWFEGSDGIHVDFIGDFCSERCARNYGLFRCENCNDWHTEDEARTVYNYGNEEVWCERCRDYEASYCDNCEEYYPRDDVSYVEETGDYLCSCCMEDYERECSSSHLHYYSWTPLLNFYNVGEDNPLYTGIELETDGGAKRGRYCDELHEIHIGNKRFADHFYMTEDSSLSNGVEITGHPMTLKYQVQMHSVYEEIRQIALRYGFGSHDGGRCGQHIHVNQSFFGKTRIARENAYFRLLRLMQRHERKFHIFSRRTSTNWCDYNTSVDYSAKDDVVKILPHTSEPSVFDKASSAACRSFHSQCVGFRDETIEFRIFRGTLKLETMYANLAMVDGLCRTVKERGSYWCESVNWYDLMDEVVKRVDDDFARECLVNYLDNKGLR